MKKFKSTDINTLSTNVKKSITCGDNNSLHPIITYFNSDLNKQLVIAQNKTKSGVYRWVNNINNKAYIGSSLDLGRRFSEYYNYNRISDPKRKYPIHTALLKYGYSNFKLEILEYCSPEATIIREQHFISKLTPEYNVLAKAGSSLGFKHSEFTRKRFSDTRLGVKRVNKVNDYNKKESLSNSVNSNKRLNLSLNSYKAIPVVLINLKTGKATDFTSQSKAAEYLEVSQTTIKNYIIQNKPCRGYNIILKK